MLCGEMIQECETVEMTACGDNCGMTLTYDQVNCGEFSFEVDVPSGWQDIFWTINGELQGRLSRIHAEHPVHRRRGAMKFAPTYENAQLRFSTKSV